MVGLMAHMIDEDLSVTYQVEDVKIISNYMLVRFNKYYCMCMTKEDLEEWLKKMEELNE